MLIIARYCYRGTEKSSTNKTPTPLFKKARSPLRLKRHRNCLPGHKGASLFDETPTDDCKLYITSSEEDYAHKTLAEAFIHLV